MARKGENIYKRKDGRWEGRYEKGRKEDSKIYYGYVYGKSHKEVKERMRQILFELKQNKHIEKEKKLKQEKINFNYLIEEWLKERKAFLKESTMVRYQNLLKLYLIPAFGAYAIEDLTYAKITKFSEELLYNGGCEGKGLSPKTVSDILSLLHCIFQYANSKGFFVPTINVNLSVKQTKKQIQVFSVEEQNKLCKYLKGHGEYTDIGILLCLFTGLRIGELCALTWQDISMEEKTIFVHQTMQRLQISEDDGKKTMVLITAPKSSCSIRQIPIPDEIFEILKKYRTVSKAFFLTGVSTKYIEPRTLQYYFKRVLKICQIEDKNFHTLRHTFATRCVEVGFDIKSLSEILGHANVNITLNRYVHPSMKLKRENMSKLSELFAVK